VAFRSIKIEERDHEAQVQLTREKMAELNRKKFEKEPIKDPKPCARCEKMFNKEFMIKYKRKVYCKSCYTPEMMENLERRHIENGSK